MKYQNTYNISIKDFHLTDISVEDAKNIEQYVLALANGPIKAINDEQAFDIFASKLSRLFAPEVYSMTPASKHYNSYWSIHLPRFRSLKRSSSKFSVDFTIDPVNQNRWQENPPPVCLSCYPLDL